MFWDEFYDLYQNWADSTIRTRISTLHDIGSNEEVIEVIENLVDEALCSQLIRKALKLGSVFTEKELAQIEDYISLNAYNEVVQQCGLNHNLAQNIAIDNLNSNIDITIRRERTVRAPLSIGGLFSALVQGLFSGNGNKKDTGRCDGDCANCPPHYGYRYGRWYYGHDHQHGCERGGNCGGFSGRGY